LLSLALRTRTVEAVVAVEVDLVVVAVDTTPKLRLYPKETHHRPQLQMVQPVKQQHVWHELLLQQRPRRQQQPEKMRRRSRRAGSVPNQ
jgi:hypothetical protein